MADRNTSYTIVISESQRKLFEQACKKYAQDPRCGEGLELYCPFGNPIDSVAGAQDETQCLADMLSLDTIVPGDCVNGFML